VNYKQLAGDKAALVMQLSSFEKDSLEIQQKVRRGIEASENSDQA